MQNGDLANQPGPRVLLIFEGALGSLASGSQAAFRKFARKQDWGKAASAWQINRLLMRQINHVTWHSNVTVEVVTFVAGPDFAAAVETMLSQLGLSISAVSYYASAVDLSNQLPYWLNILAVYDPDAMRSMTYGAKGRHLVSAHDLGR
jgi:hypothetical protein